MRKRIEELARGKFECAGPILQISTDKVEIEVLEGKNYTGEFIITSVNHVPMKGFLYSSNPRMDCLTPKFEGEEVRIRYEFHSEGLMEGDIQKGDFFIICNQGEYNLSFVVSVLNLYADSMVGSIRNLSDFTKLARDNWEEARRIFYSPLFKNILKSREEKEKLLYEGIAGGHPSGQSMEEYLVTTGKKQRIQVETACEAFEFYGVKEVRREILTLKKTQWGFVSLAVSSDAGFLIPDKERITTEDFVGSVCDFSYYLNPDEMHAGKNFGRLIFENIYQQFVITFCVSIEEEGVVKSPELRERRRLNVELMKLYQDYRVKKIVTGRWAVRSCEILDALIAIDQENVWYRLMKAQAFLVNSQRQEAEWILDSFKREWKDRKSPQWGYYLYLCTLMEREESYVNRVTEEIEQIYSAHKEEIMLFVCLLFLREEYENNRSRKLRAIQQRVAEEKESPLLYIEAYSLFLQEPFLLNHLGSFELRTLNWIRKQNALSYEISEQIIRILPDKQEYQRLVLLLLEACYEKVPTEQTAGAICAYLIKNQRYGKRFFSWYEKGVELKLRITGLYEAYLMSMDIHSIVEVPKIILMYFKYNNHLAYRQKAMLYVNIIANKEKQAEIYQQYRQSMELFALEQIGQHRMDDNLAVIYEEVFRGGIKGKELSDALSLVLFIHKITCFEKKAKYAIVLQKQLKRPQIVPFTGGVAYIQLFSNDYCIFIEDSLGNRYCGNISYQLEKLMHPFRYLQQCLKYSPEKLPYLLYYFDNRKGSSVLEENELLYFSHLIESGEISVKYRAYLYPKMLKLVQETGGEFSMENYLSGIDISLMQPAEKTIVLKMLADHMNYDEAYRIAERYGISLLLPADRVKVLSYEIIKINFEEEDTLLGFCETVFSRDNYNATVIEYLCRYYEGSTKAMALVWRAAKGLHVDTREIEERILIQMLYTTEFIDCVSELYASYEKEGDRQVKEAYLSYFSYHYFVKDMVVPDNLFEYLKEQIASSGEVQRMIKLAMLKSLCEQGQISGQEEELQEALLRECIREGMYFSFYSKVNHSLKVKYQLHDKVFLEYRSSKGCRVQVHYKTDSKCQDFAAEDMNDMYQGIFVKEFITFYGDSVQYYISEEEQGRTEVTESNRIENDGQLLVEQAGRYGAINKMLQARETEGAKGLAEQMRCYLDLEREVEARFSIL